MSRIKTMLMAMVAVLAIGAVGASAASADGDGRAEVPLLGGCDITFETDGWVGTDPWSTEVSNITAEGDEECLVDEVSGGGELTKHSDGEAEFESSDITIYSGDNMCVYFGTLTGIWYWTLHNSTVRNGPPPIGEPGDDKYFILTGVPSLDEEASEGDCPSAVPLVLTIRTHEH